jgi:hypothetical protein
VGAAAANLDAAVAEADGLGLGDPQVGVLAAPAAARHPRLRPPPDRLQEAGVAYRVLGVHIIGPRAGDLIAEVAVAVEFGAEAALSVDGRPIHL